MSVQQKRDTGGLDGCGIGNGLVCEIVGEVVANSEVNETSDGEYSLDQARKLNMAIGAQFPMFARTGFFFCARWLVMFQPYPKAVTLGPIPVKWRDQRRTVC